jgi:hypothetical protein
MKTAAASSLEDVMRACTNDDIAQEKYQLNQLLLDLEAIPLEVC